MLTEAVRRKAAELEAGLAAGNQEEHQGTGNAAASTAEPQPPNTSQNVPRNSAAIFFILSPALLPPAWNRGALQRLEVRHDGHKTLRQVSPFLNLRARIN